MGRVIFNVFKEEDKEFYEAYYSELPNGYLETMQNGIADVRSFRSGLSRATAATQTLRINQTRYSHF